MSEVYWSWTGKSKVTPPFSDLAKTSSVCSLSWQWLNNEKAKRSSDSTNVWATGGSKEGEADERLNRAKKSVVESGLFTRSPLHIMSLTIAGDLTRGPPNSRANSPSARSSTSSSSSEVSVNSPKGPKAECHRTSVVTSRQLLQNSTGEVGGVGKGNEGKKSCEHWNSNFSRGMLNCGKEVDNGSRLEKQFMSSFSLEMRCMEVESEKPAATMCCKWIKP